MPPAPAALGHINPRAPAAVVERLRGFQTDVIGLRDGPRPAFRSGSRGYWLYAGGAAVLHLTIDEDIAPAVGARPSAFDHFALVCDDLGAVRARLDAAGIACATDRIDAVHQVQWFLRDPAGVGVEPTFAPSR